MLLRPAQLLLFFLLCSGTLCAQGGYLFVKKGASKKRTYTEGSRIHLLMNNGEERRGIITLLLNDTIYINGKVTPRVDVAAVILDEAHKKPFPADAKTLLLIGAGAGLTGLGLSLNHANKPSKAFIAGGVIGFAPLLLKHFGGRLIYGLTRKRFRIGKKYRLQVIDFHIPKTPRTPRAF